MNVQDLKDYIFDNDYIEQILEEIECHSIIKHNDEYITCANKTGDNKQAIVIYLNSNLTCINYTRSMTKNKRTHDIFDLVSYNENLSFSESLKFVCDIFGIDYYGYEQEIPESLQIMKMLKGMSIEDNTEDNIPLRPIPEEILGYYLPYPNKMFEDDGISLTVQKEFGIGYDPQTNRITIPLRSPIGDLCGVKGRLFGEPDEYNPKYLYIERCAKSQMIYGYYENKEYIKNSDIIFCGEAEKFTLQLASCGYRNALSLGGKTVSKTQMELLVRTGAKICFALDKDVEEDELRAIAKIFPENVPIYAIIDKDNILENKESPSDDINKWLYLVKNNIYQIK